MADEETIDAAAEATKESDAAADGQVNEDDVLTALEDVIDPELGFNVVDIGLIYDVAIDDGRDVRVNMTLTSPGCPVGPQLLQEAQDAVEGIEGTGDVKVNLTFSPPWTPDEMSDEIKAQFGRL